MTRWCVVMLMPLSGRLARSGLWMVLMFIDQFFDIPRDSLSLKLCFERRFEAIVLDRSDWQTGFGNVS